MHNLIELLANPVVLTAITGVVVSLIIQGLKKVADLNDLPNKTWVVRAGVAVLAIVSTLVLQTTGHSIIDPGLWTGIVQAGLLYLTAHLTHQGVFHDPSTTTTG